MRREPSASPPARPPDMLLAGRVDAAFTDFWHSTRRSGARDARRRASGARQRPVHGSAFEARIHFSIGHHPFRHLSEPARCLFRRLSIDVVLLTRKNLDAEPRAAPHRRIISDAAAPQLGARLPPRHGSGARARDARPASSRRNAVLPRTGAEAMSARRLCFTARSRHRLPRVRRGMRARPVGGHRAGPSPSDCRPALRPATSGRSAKRS